MAKSWSIAVAPRLVVTCQDFISNTKVEEIGIDDTASMVSDTKNSIASIFVSLRKNGSDLHVINESSSAHTILITKIIILIMMILMLMLIIIIIIIIKQILILMNSKEKLHTKSVKIRNQILRISSYKAHLSADKGIIHFGLFSSNLLWK